MQLSKALDVIVASQGSSSSAVGPLVRELSAIHRLLAAGYRDADETGAESPPGAGRPVNPEVEELSGRIARTDERLDAIKSSVFQLMELIENRSRNTPRPKAASATPETTGAGRSATAKSDAEKTVTRAQLNQLKSRNTELEREVSRHRDVEVSLLTTMRDIRAASQAKSEFLANMSHELRTPLNAIIGFAEIMESQLVGPLGSEQYVGYAKDVRESGQYLLELINDILDLSKIESGQLEFVEDVVDLRDSVEVCMRMIADQAEEAGLKTSLDIAADIPNMRANTRMIRQILLNLLSNAVKFTPSGGEIGISLFREDRTGDIMVVVKDNGIGIAQRNIARVMRPFEQVEGTARDTTHRGTGLGLPMAKSLVELHGGTFTLDSVVDEGTTITLRFPAKRAA
ncbi:MAG: HAMP domain-containing sensor histidine kinase [Alphaproteobacteria bacterium]